MKSFKKISVICLGLLFLLASVGCQSQTADNPTIETNTTNQRVKDVETQLMGQLEPMPKFNNGENLGALIISLTNPYWVSMKGSYEDAAKLYGVNMEVQSGNTEGDKQSQLETLESMSVKGYDSLVVSPIEPYNLVPGIVKANEKSIPVINLGPGVDVKTLEEAGGKLNGRLTVDFEEQGRLAAEDIVKKIGGSGKVAIIQGIPGAGQSEGRTKGAKTVFEGAEGVELVSVQPADWDSATANRIATDLLKAHPDLKGIFACNDVMALAASEAVINTNGEKNVVIYGVDGIEEAVNAIKDGRLDGTIAYPVSAYGKAAVVMAIKLAQGETISEAVYCPLDVINTENISEFDGYK